MAAGARAKQARTKASTGAVRGAPSHHPKAGQKRKKEARSVFAPAPDSDEEEEEEGDYNKSSVHVRALVRGEQNGSSTKKGKFGKAPGLSSVFAAAPSDSEQDEDDDFEHEVDSDEGLGDEDESEEDDIIDLIANDDEGDDNWEYVKTARRTSELRHCPASHSVLKAEHVKKLQHDGLVIIDNTIPRPKLQEAVKDCARVRTEGHFGDSPNENEDIRSDRVHFLTDSDRQQREREQRAQLGRDYVQDESLAMSGKEKGLLYVQGFLQGLGAALEAHGFVGCSRSSKAEKGGQPVVLKVPEPVQLAVYSGDSGARYSAHRDGAEEGSADADMQAYSLRVVTAILYLNDTSSPWDKKTHGGCLRCYMGADKSDKVGTTATEIVDIEPVGGRLVLFSSQAILHEVMPTHRDRFAATVWFLREGATAPR
eukprot:TRINITY_DN48560_c0_g1_i1.p1 TRINITY_DN48560_c0_g1~~TRINITY_DN48560_c0_g1_i1.p1  ORF type:complete len:470 (-),score=52.16 TRINITY_DN48560_c0_g1_i1:169-1443(-)